MDYFSPEKRFLYISSMLVQSVLGGTVDLYTMMLIDQYYIVLLSDWPYGSDRQDITSHCIPEFCIPEYDFW